MKLIENHKSYTEIFKKLAAKHRDIRHGTPEGRISFVRCVLSGHPLMKNNDLEEFMKTTLNSLKFPAMVLIAYGTDYAMDNYDAKRKIINGEYVIFDKVQRDEYDGVEEKLDSTEKIGESILGFLDSYYSNNPNDGLLQVGDNNAEKIRMTMSGTDLAGSKFYFSISMPHNVELEYNESMFLDDDDELLDLIGD
jgi:hypothetical protein